MTAFAHPAANARVVLMFHKIVAPQVMSHVLHAVLVLVVHSLPINVKLMLILNVKRVLLVALVSFSPLLALPQLIGEYQTSARISYTSYASSFPRQCQDLTSCNSTEYQKTAPTATTGTWRIEKHIYS